MKVIYADGTPGELADLPWLTIVEPVEGAITQAFGVRSITGILHRGEDRSAIRGTLIHAVHDGVVSFVRGGSWEWSGPLPYKDGVLDSTKIDLKYGGYGNQVTIDHERTVQSHYAHLYWSRVTQGQQVRAGDIIGAVGSTGISTGPHLHYELRFTDLTRFDPQPYYSKPPEEDDMTDEERAALAWLVRNKGNLSPYALAAEAASFNAANDGPGRDGVTRAIDRLMEFLDALQLDQASIAALPVPKYDTLRRLVVDLQERVQEP